MAADFHFGVVLGLLALPAMVLFGFCTERAFLWLRGR